MKKVIFTVFVLLFCAVLCWVGSIHAESLNDIRMEQDMNQIEQSFRMDIIRDKIDRMNRDMDIEILNRRNQRMLDDMDRQKEKSTTDWLRFMREHR